MLNRKTKQTGQFHIKISTSNPRIQNPPSQFLPSPSNHPPPLPLHPHGTRRRGGEGGGTAQTQASPQQPWSCCLPPARRDPSGVEEQKKEKHVRLWASSYGSDPLAKRQTGGWGWGAFYYTRGTRRCRLLLLALPSSLGLIPFFFIMCFFFCWMSSSLCVNRVCRRRCRLLRNQDGRREEKAECKMSRAASFSLLWRSEEDGDFCCGVRFRDGGKDRIRLVVNPPFWVEKMIWDVGDLWSFFV